MRLVFMALWVALIAGATALVPSHSVVAVEAPACALGTHYADESNNGFTVLVFTSTDPCDWEVPAGITAIDLLLVGGGGGGGAIVGGGGGGGAVVTHSALAVTPGTRYTVGVGPGGDGAKNEHHNDTDPTTNTFTVGKNGGHSTFASGGTSLNAPGGGVGGSWNGTTDVQLPGSGGSGGGSGSTTSAGSGAPGGNGGNADTDGQPHAAGGGGGAVGDGLPGSGGGGGAGGLGTSLNFVTTSVFVNYGGGGGGAVHGTWSGGTLNTPVLPGGQGAPDGGGDGRAPQSSASGMVQGGHGTDGLGGGGGGAANNLIVANGGSIGGDGGDGVIVIRWWNPVAQTITFTRPSDRVLSASTFDVAPISDSGLVVTVSSSTPGVCTVAGFTVTMLATGTCTLTASQAGNATYAAAPDVTRSFTISSASTTTVPPPPPSSTSTSSSTTTTTVPPPPPSSTSTTITPPTPTTPPAPLPADPATGGLPSLEPGTSLVTENGVPIAADLLMENQTDATLRGQDFALRLSLEREGWAQVSGEGFLPGTPVYAWLFSEPQFLGEFTVKADGTFAGRVPLTGVEVGSHTLQINGTSVDGAARSANLGVVVQDVTVPAPGPGALPSTGSGTGLMWLAVTALAGGALVATARRCRPFHE